MTDTERVQMMEDMNWKPAITYWKEQADKKDVEIARLREALIDLMDYVHAFFDDSCWQYENAKEALK